MNEKKTPLRLTRSEGFSLMAEYFRSGMGAAEFYRSRHISEWQFYKWRRLYLQAHPDAVRPKNLSDNDRPLFHPVEITGQPSSRPFPSLEIIYPGGVTLRIGEGLDDICLIRELITL